LAGETEILGENLPTCMSSLTLHKERPGNCDMFERKLALKAQRLVILARF
jgi:hypothetical protein